MALFTRLYRLQGQQNIFTRLYRVARSTEYIYKIIQGCKVNKIYLQDYIGLQGQQNIFTRLYRVARSTEYKIKKIKISD